MARPLLEHVRYDASAHGAPMTHTHRGPRRRGPRKAAGAFHDLSNCVHGIAMAVELALDDAALLPAQHQSYLRDIRCRCRELARLAQNLRALGALGREGEAYVVVCTHCDRTIVVAEHIGQEAAAAMADHVRLAHPELVRGTSSTG